MKKRLHQYLDGELGREVLSPKELREIAAYENVIRETGEVYRSIEVPDLTARIMARLPVHRANPGTLNRFNKGTLAWLWSMRQVTFRPLYAIALVALIVVLALANLPLGLRTLKIFDRNADTQNLHSKVFVQFRLNASQASEVRLAGSFTGWTPTYPLQQVSPGVWSIVIPLEPGVHDYAFIVDGGHWIADTGAPSVDDGFGGVNSRVSVLLPDGDSRL